MSGIRFKAKANIEWTPVTLSYNLKKRFHVDADLPTMSSHSRWHNLTTMP